LLSPLQARIRRLALAATAGLLLLVPAMAEEQHDAGHEEHASDIDTWKWANFAIIAGLIGWAASKYGGPFFQARTLEIRKEIDEAARIQEDAERRYAAVEARLANLDKEIAELRANAEAEGRAELVRLKAETDAQLVKIERHSQNQIAAALKTARIELRSYATTLAIELAEKRVRERLSAENERMLIGSFVKGIEQNGRVRPTA
jgi:F-type H+-transporting ATPase subunit b